MNKRNATASWSGYIHQGRVGILVALRELRLLLENNKKDELDGYILVYENAEDFDIQKNGCVVSRHQVKCKKEGNNLSDYKDVLSVQEKIYEDQQWKIINPGFQILEYKSDGSVSDPVIDDENRYLHTICEVRGFGLSEDEYEEWIRCNKISKNSKYCPNHNNLKLYEYEKNKFYCDLKPHSSSLLRQYSIREIEEIIILESKNSPIDISTMGERYDQIISKLDEKINFCHVSNNMDYPNIKFSDLLEFVLKRLDVEADILGVFRKLLSEYWEEYKSQWIENLLDLPNITDKDFERVESLLNELACYNDSQLNEFIRKIQTVRNPQNDTLTISDLNSMCTETQLRQIFFKVLVSVETENFLLEQSIFNEDGGYVLSLIDNGKDDVKRTVCDIMKNRSLLKNVYEKEYLINENINDIPIFGMLDDPAICLQATNWGHNNDILEKKDFRKSQLRFINVPNAIEKLKGE